MSPEQTRTPADQPQQVEPDTPHSGAPAELEARTPQVIQTGPGNVDKIRDILFGTQMRDYEMRFARIEETLAKETADIRETNRRRLDHLENYIRKELEAVQLRLKTDRDEQSDLAGQHVRELKDLGDSLSRRIRDLDDRGAAVERDLRSQLLKQSNDLADEIRAKNDELSTLLEKRFQELRQGKTDRAALASLLNEVALRLGDQFQIPGADA